MGETDSLQVVFKFAVVCRIVYMCVYVHSGGIERPYLLVHQVLKRANDPLYRTENLSKVQSGVYNLIGK